MARYGMADEVLSFMTRNVIEAKSAGRLDATTTVLQVNELTNGITFKTSDVGLLLEVEKHIEDTCAALDVKLRVLESYGGEDLIEF